MAGARKKGDYSVLAEINTEEEWDNLCTRQVKCQNMLMEHLQINSILHFITVHV